MRRYKRILFCFIIISIIAFTAGCKSRETFVETTPTPTPSIDKQIKEVDSGPVRGGTLTLPVTPVDTLNPYRTKDRYVNYISFFIFESLFAQPKEGQVSPCLVDSWENEGDTLWTFKLRNDVFFHHGSALNSDDVKYTLKVLEGSGSPFYNTDITNNIEEFNVISHIQFEIRLKERDPDFLEKLTFPVLPQVMETQTTEYISGTGPYRFDSMDESMVRLRINEKWWQDSPPYLDSVVFRIYPKDSILDAFQNNEVDVSFINNVDFSKFDRRGDIGYQVYPDNMGVFVRVNPEGLFGQANRQKALFSYISFRLYDLNLGQIHYFDEFIDGPIDGEEFRNAMVASGLQWNEARGKYTHGGNPLQPITIVVPKQDMQKLHIANFLVNILQDVGIQANIQAVNADSVNKVIRSGKYDLSPVAEELKPWETLDETLKRMQEELGYGNDNSFILPLYRNQQAMLYNKHLRGEKNADFWNPYRGFTSWYKPLYVESSPEG